MANPLRHHRSAALVTALVITGTSLGVSPALADPTTPSISSSRAGSDWAVTPNPDGSMPTSGRAPDTTSAAPDTTGTTVAPTTPSTTRPAGPAGCAVVHAIALQGTNESAEGQDPRQDSGMLSKVIVPVSAKFSNDRSKFDRTYVPYPADFGWRGNTYAQSVTKGLGSANKVITDIARRCPTTKFMILAYSQGGQIGDTLLRRIGNGNGPVPAAQVAGGMLFSSPNRPPGSGFFPGADGQSTPGAIPGTPGTAVRNVRAGTTSPDRPGGGIAPDVAGTPQGYGELTGRVASACIPGDLACDMPAGAPLARLVTNVGGQLNLNTEDPVGILTSVANVVGTTAIKTAADVINNDISTTDGTTAGLQYQPQQSLLGRASVASDPQYQTDVFGALQKVLGIAINTGITIARKVITPANIAEIGTVGLTNPAAGLALFGSKLGQAALEMLPQNWANQAETAIVNELSTDIRDNKQLIAMAADVTYWNTAKHFMYDKTPLAADGATAVQFATNWAIAAVTDLLSAMVTTAGNAPDSSLITLTSPVGGPDSYNGLPGLNMPRKQPTPDTTSYNPWTTETTDPQAPTYQDGVTDPGTDTTVTPTPTITSTPAPTTTQVPSASTTTDQTSTPPSATP